MLLAAAGAAAVVGLAVPGAHAAEGDWDHEKSSSSHESSSYSKDHDKHGKHDAPRGGMHTGGGALTAAGDDEWSTARDPKFDPETYRNGNNGTDAYKNTKHDPETYKDSHAKGHHDKPHGGMHTGGGALASPGVTAGGLAVLAVAGTGLYAARRNRPAGSMA
ncbi:membrane protein [Streptomyces sp. MMG1533]|nr:membrane protein [Streptomyces sp. MMG1533]